MNDLDTLCPGCMNKKLASNICQSCGEEFLLKSYSQALPLRSILNNRFLIGRVLGRPGGFGITYLAWDISLQTTAAIKEFLPTCSVAREKGNTDVIPNSKEDMEVFSGGLQMFMEEARTLIQFAHPNITRIRDYFTANNTAYLVMEYHQGLPLDQYVKKFEKPLSEDNALGIMLPILDGLQAVHQKDFLHRDVKPQNIYLTENGTPILLDFGSARFAVGNKTSTLTIMLTAGFAPFEQYHQKGRQGPWTDLYACAATLYFLTTGKVPADALERQYNDQLIAPIQLNPGLSESFSSAIVKTLAIDFQNRPKSVAAFRSLLLGTPGILSGDVQQTIHFPTQSITTAPSTVRRPTIKATEIRSKKQNISHRRTHIKQNSNAGKRLIGILAVIVGILSWDFSDSVDTSTTHSNKTDVSDSNPIRITKFQEEVDLIEEKDEDNALSYASMPAIEEVDGSFFPDENIAPNRTLPSTSPQSHAQSLEPDLPMLPHIAGVDPRHAIQACRGVSLNKPCQLSSPHGTVRGRCFYSPNNQLVCIPAPPHFSHRNPARTMKPFNR